MNKVFSDEYLYAKHRYTRRAIQLGGKILCMAEMHWFSSHLAMLLVPSAILSRSVPTCSLHSPVCRSEALVVSRSLTHRE